MLGEILLGVVLVVVRVDEDAPLDLVASGQAVADAKCEGVGHVRSVLSGSANGLAVPVPVGGNKGVVLVRHLVVGLADGVGDRVNRGGRGGRGRRG